MDTFKIAFFALAIGIISCTPKITEDNSTLPPLEEEKVIEPLGPCVTLDQLNAVEKDQIETCYVIYRDFYKQKNFKAAYPLWKKAFETAPAANGRIKYQYDDGVGIYKEFFNSESDETLKKMHVDSIMSIYDKRAECTGDEGYSAGRKAFDYYYYFKDYIEEDELFELFQKAIDLKGEQADYFVINPFTSLVYDRVLKNKISKEEGRAYAQTITSAISFGKTNCKKDCEAWEIVSEYAPAKLENLEGVEGFYDCAYYENKYYALFLESPQDCEVINTAYRRMLWGGCDVNDPIVVEISQSKDNNCYTPPPKEGNLKQGYTAYTEGRYSEAIAKFEEFIASTADNDKKAKYALLIAKIYYGDLKNFPKSRKKALEAASYKPNWGDPFILIGKLYASSGPLCGPGRGWDSQIVTWPAIDKFEYAKKIDPSVAAEANKWISSYKKYMPKKEDIFFRNLAAGSSFKVECWINETTKIRTAD